MKLRPALAAAIVLAAIASSSSTAGAAGDRVNLLRKIDTARAQTWSCQDRRAIARTPAERAERRSRSRAFRRWVLELWQQRARSCELAERRDRQIPWPWVAVADCETGDGDGRPPYRATWDYNGSSGFDGGLQFLPSTWVAARRLVPGASRYAYAYEAPARVQVAVAARWLLETSWLQWPACSAKIGLR